MKKINFIACLLVSFFLAQNVLAGPNILTINAPVNLKLTDTFRYSYTIKNTNNALTIYEVAWSAFCPTSPKAPIQTEIIKLLPGETKTFTKTSAGITNDMGPTCAVDVKVFDNKKVLVEEKVANVTMLGYQEQMPYYSLETYYDPTGLNAGRYFTTGKVYAKVSSANNYIPDTYLAVWLTGPSEYAKRWFVEFDNIFDLGYLTPGAYQLTLIAVKDGFRSSTSYTNVFVVEDNDPARATIQKMGSNVAVQGIKITEDNIIYEKINDIISKILNNK